MLSTVSQAPGFRPTVSRPMSWVFGVRPIATSSSSASSCSPSVSVMDTVPSSLRLTDPASAPMRTETPLSRNDSATRSPTNGS